MAAPDEQNQPNYAEVSGISPSPPAAAVPASARPAAGPQDRSVPAPDEYTRAQNAEVSGVSPSPSAAAVPASARPATGPQDRSMPAPEEEIPAKQAELPEVSPSSPATAAPASTSSPADPENGRMSAQDGQTPPNHAEVSGSSCGAQTKLPDNRPSGSENTTISGSAGSSSTTEEGGHGTPLPEPRNAISVASTATKCAPPSGEQPTGDRGQNMPAGQTGVESGWNTATPASADRAVPSAAPAPEPSQTRPAAGEPAEPAAQPVTRDVSLHLTDGQSGVDIRMAERAGEIRVTVHTPDRDLANSLRADLPDLVGKLRQSGFEAEAWRPAATLPDAGRRGGSHGSPSQEHSPGARRDGRQQQQQQPKNQSRWAGEWKSSLDPAQEPYT